MHKNVSMSTTSNSNKMTTADEEIEEFYHRLNSINRRAILVNRVITVLNCVLIAVSGMYLLSFFV
jgi:hypothetical protein